MTGPTMAGAAMSLAAATLAALFKVLIGRWNEFRLLDCLGRSERFAARRLHLSRVRVGAPARGDDNDNFA
jgi:hypothetical protein